MTVDALTRRAPARRVRVWFGDKTVADQTFDADKAVMFEAGMRRRFAGLKVTNDPVDPRKPGTTA
jgi:hypothetical protein